MYARNRKKAVGHSRRRGFTLVELLVVISIIALLIAILLPSLSKARDSAKAVVCASRIKGILGAMSVYAAANKDYIAGSPNTSGSVLFGPQNQNEAGMYESWRWDPVQVWDWGGGMARSMGMRFSVRSHEERFKEVLRETAFKCPSNRILSQGHEENLSRNFGYLPMPSYNTSRNFMWPGKPKLMSGDFSGNQYWDVVGVGYNWEWESFGPTKRRKPPDWAEASKETYLPRVDQVGAPADKVFIADGAWHTVALIVSPLNNEAVLYVDGVPDGSGSASFSSLATGTNKLNYGCLYNNGGRSDYAGCVLDAAGCAGSGVEADLAPSSPPPPEAPAAMISTTTTATAQTHHFL